MFKKYFLLSTLITVIFSCTKKDVFTEDTQIIYQPIAVCENGLAGEYPCNDYDLLTYISLEDLGGIDTKGNDCWGWTDPDTQKEYALMGTNKGTV